MKKFEVGKTYRFHGGYRFTVTARTEGTVTVDNGHGFTPTLRIHRGYSSICAVEVLMPFGTENAYLLRADAEISE